MTAVPGWHGPGVADALLPPVRGSVWELDPAPGGPPPLRLYVTGDTLVHEALADLPRRDPHLDVGVWHLGGTKMLGLTVTMDGVAGADLLELVRPRVCVPVHHSHDGVFRSPLPDFLAEVQRRGLPGVHPLRPGEVLPLPSRAPT